MRFFLFAVVLLLSPVLGRSAAAGPSGTESPRLVLHTVSATSKVGTCIPTLPSCEAAATHTFTGNGEFFQHVYLLAARFDTAAGVREIHVGLSYDTVTLSGADIFAWNLCADGESPTAGWYQEGGANLISWNEKSRDSLCVAGYFYVTAYSPGYLALVPPEGGDAALTPFSGPSVILPISSLGYIGFGSQEGCNPCIAACAYTPVRPSTWSSIKSFFIPSRQ